MLAFKSQLSQYFTRRLPRAFGPRNDVGFDSRSFCFGAVVIAPTRNFYTNENARRKAGVVAYFRESMAFLAALTAAGEAYWRSNSLAMGRPMGTPSRLNFMGPGSLALALRWKWHTPVSR